MANLKFEKSRKKSGGPLKAVMPDVKSIVGVGRSARSRDTSNDPYDKEFLKNPFGESVVSSLEKAGNIESILEELSDLPIVTQTIERAEAQQQFRDAELQRTQVEGTQRSELGAFRDEQGVNRTQVEGAQRSTLGRFRDEQGRTRSRAEGTRRSALGRFRDEQPVAPDARSTVRRGGY